MPNSEHDHVETVIREGRAFLDRHPDLPGSVTDIGALTWGILRAIMECPHCPGAYRVPVRGVERETIVCPSCGGVWVRKADANG